MTDHDEGAAPVRVRVFHRHHHQGIALEPATPGDDSVLSAFDEPAEAGERVLLFHCPMCGVDVRVVLDGGAWPE